MKRQPLSSALVVQALHVRGIEVDAAKVHLPAAFDVATAAPELELADADRDPRGRLRVRLRCVKLSDCVAFMATLDVDGPEADAMLTRVRNGAGRSARDAVRQASAVLHAGDSLEMTLERQHSVLRFSCVAIDTGSVGMTIRVRTPDHGRIFRAVVLGPAQARGVAE